MGDGTGIEWTDASWNIFRGCSRTIAAGAEQSGCGDPSGGGCYAERNGWRFAGAGGAYEGLVRMTPNGARWTGKVLLVDEHLLDPIRWRRPRKIFTTAVSDPYHERFTNESIAVAVGIEAASPQHTHQMLTKRAARAREWHAWVIEAAAAAGMTPAAFCFSLAQRYVTENRRGVFTDSDRKLIARADVVDVAMSAPWPLPNVVAMVSVENQAAAAERIPHLIATPAATRGLSLEPLLEPVDLTPWIRRVDHCSSCGAENPPQEPDRCPECDCDNCLISTWGDEQAELYRDGERHAELFRDGPEIHWAIAGCESGPGARPIDADAFRGLLAQCSAGDVAFFNKQMVVDGKLRKSLDEFPPDLRVRQFPEAHHGR